MFLRKKWLWFLIVPLIVIVFVYIMMKDKQPKYSLVEETSGLAIEEIRAITTTADLMHDFITSMLPYGIDIFLEFDVENGKTATLEELRRETLQSFYLAIQNLDLDLLTFSVSSESIHELLDNEIDIETRINILQETLEDLRKNEQLKPIRYQFEKDKYGVELDKGQLYMSYKDGHEFSVEFELESNGDDSEKYYQIVTSLKDMLLEIK